MTVPPPLPQSLQPASKGSSTAKSTHLSAVANSTPDTSRSSSQVRPLNTRQNANSDKYISEKATSILIRRVLGPQNGFDPRSSPRSIEQILPPLTSSNEIDLQLYAIIAIVVKEFIQTWYSKITPDHVFVEEVVRIIAHCSRAIEQRLRRIHVEEVIFDEIAALVEAHIVAYRTAHETLSPSAYQSSPMKIYHSLNPHPAMSPCVDAEETETGHLQAQNEAIYRQLLVQGALAVLLPTEDLQNACLRTLVSDIIADLILGQGISSKACEGWFLQETVTRMIGAVRSHVKPQAKAKGMNIEHGTRSRLEKFGLLSPKDGESTHHLSDNSQSLVLALFWRILQYAYLLFLFARFVVAGLLRARSLPSWSRASKSHPPLPIARKEGGPMRPSQSRSTLPSSPQRPILDYRFFTLLSTLLDLATRMPWLIGLLSLCKHGILIGSGRLGAADSILEKFLHDTLTTYVTPWSSLVPVLLLNLRITIFPFNSLERGPPNPSPPPPTPEQQLQIRRRAAEAILGLIPRRVATVYFASNSSSSRRRGRSNRPDEEEEQQQQQHGGEDEEVEAAEAEATVDQQWEDMIGQVEEILDVFANPYMNKHLVYNILELVLVRLVPEMASMTPTELLAERGVGVGVDVGGGGGGGGGGDSSSGPV